MSTTLRGNGSYKKELLFDLYSSFGFQQFKVEQVKSIPSYSQSTFSSLFYDGWLHKTNKNSPCTWRLSNRIESIIKNTNTELHGDVSFDKSQTPSFYDKEIRTAQTRKSTPPTRIYG